MTNEIKENDVKEMDTVDFWQDRHKKEKSDFSLSECTFHKMRKRSKVGLTLCAVMMAASMFILPVYGDNEDLLAQYKAEQAQLQKELAAQKKELQAAKTKEKELRTRVAELDAELTTMEKEMASVEKKLSQAVDQIAVTTKELEKTQAEMEERMTLFQNRMREIYMNGEVSMMDVVFDSTSFSDFLIRYELWGRVMEVDKKMLQQIEADLAVIEEKKAALEEKKSTLEALKKEKESSMENLENLKDQKAKFLEAAEENREQAQQLYDEMEAADADIAKKIQALQPKGNGKYNGIFTWPLPGHTRVSSDYVYRLHPTLKVYKWHTGIDLPAPKGTKIIAAADGKVIFSGWNNAYGNMVIIDHGNGLSSLYGHMSAITMKTTGQQVKAGDEVGKVGTTGYSTGNHLHFETRINGKHTSPWPYLK